MTTIVNEAGRRAATSWPFWAQDPGGPPSPRSWPTRLLPPASSADPALGPAHRSRGADQRFAPQPAVPQRRCPAGEHQGLDRCRGSARRRRHWWSSRFPPRPCGRSCVSGSRLLRARCPGGVPDEGPGTGHGRPHERSDLRRSWAFPPAGWPWSPAPTWPWKLRREEPTASVVACTDAGRRGWIARSCTAPYFRPYTTTDVVGVEIGGIVKNVIALAVGICEGKQMGDNTKASVITRGLAETSRLCLGAGRGSPHHGRPCRPGRSRGHLFLATVPEPHCGPVAGQGLHP